MALHAAGNADWGNAAIMLGVAGLEYLVCLVGVAAARWQERDNWLRERPEEPLCPQCGYSLYYVTRQRCPECGREFQLSELDLRLAEWDSQILRPCTESAAESSSRRVRWDHAHTWGITLADRQGVLWLWRLPVPDLQGLPGPLEVTIGGNSRQPRDEDELAIQTGVLEPIWTVSRCRAGWLDPRSATLATLEAGPNEPLIRLYSGSRKVIATYTPRIVEGPLDILSPPTVLEGGRRVAFADAGNVVVGEIQLGTAEFWQVCRLPGWHTRVTSHINGYWLNDQTLLFEHGHRVIEVSLATRRWRRWPDGRLYGVVAGQIVQAGPAGVALYQLDEQMQHVLGRVKTDIACTGHWIHRVSPDGRHVIYDTSWRHDKILVLQDLASGGSVHIRPAGSPVMHVGSWHIE